MSPKLDVRHLIRPMLCTSFLLNPDMLLSMSRKDVTPAEREVFMKYRKKGARRAAVGGLFGALAMASVWKIAALATVFGVTGVIGSLPLVHQAFTFILCC